MMAIMVNCYSENYNFKELPQPDSTHDTAEFALGRASVSIERLADLVDEPRSPYHIMAAMLRVTWEHISTELHGLSLARDMIYHEQLVSGKKFQVAVYAMQQQYLRQNPGADDDLHMISNDFNAEHSICCQLIGRAIRLLKEGRISHWARDPTSQPPIELFRKGAQFEQDIKMTRAEEISLREFEERGNNKELQEIWHRIAADIGIDIGIDLEGSNERRTQESDSREVPEGEGLS